MKKIKMVLIILISLVVLSGAAIFVLTFLKPKPAGLLVRTQPEASVYINGILVGKTPYKDTRTAGKVSIKVVPETENSNLMPFETKISLVSGIVTVITREFGDSEETSSGDVLSFDKLSSKETSLVVVTTPDNAQISLDGVPRGFAPYKTSLIASGVHQITIKSPDYLDRVMTVNIEPGFRLTVFAKLAKGKMQALSATATPAPLIPKKFVEILSTPTGFLRVRTEPGASGEEIAEVKPGARYPLIETDEATGWHKIQYQEPKPGLPKGITGWVSSQYTKIIEEVGTEATGSGKLDS